MNRWDARAQAPKAPNLWRFVAIALLVPLAMVVVAAWLSAQYSHAEGMRTQARASFNRRIETIATLSSLKEAETNQRGYIITGNPQFLDGSAIARDAVRREMVDLRTAFADDAGQTARLNMFARTIDAKFSEMDEVIRLRRSSGLEVAAVRVSEGLGKRLMDQASSLANTMIATEETEGTRRVNLYTDGIARTRSTVWGIVGLGSAALAFGLWMLWNARKERYDTEVRAHEAAERHRIIFDSTTDAIAILNPSGSIETINSAASQMLGYTAEELQRRDVSVLIDLLDRPVTFHTRIGLVDGQLRQPFLMDRKLKHRDGREIPVDIALGVMQLPDGDHIVASVRDISERKRLERIKDDLMSTVSHELRTPLTSIVGALGLLRGGVAGKLPSKAGRLVEIAENNSRRLIRLINDMLDMDRIDAGKLRVERTRTDLRETMQLACQGGQGLTADGAFKLAYDAPDEPIIVDGDAERLLQVVSNLVSNAARVSPQGATVRVGVTLIEHGRTARVTVDDQGPGVPPAFRDRIFGRFERAERHESTVGTGLGLAISRELVRLHHGTIWFEDLPGGGTRFAFTIPVAEGVGHIDPVTDGPRLLICEDDPAVARVLREMTAAEGYASDWASTAAEARALIAKDGYSAVLLDLKLPGENGLSFARTLRSGSETRALPIIVVSALSREGVDEVIPFDFVDWIEKPIVPERLCQALNIAVSRSGVTKPVILHLDDDKDVLDVTAVSLGNYARVLQATDLAGARTILENESPDIAILDLQLEEGSGLDLLPYLVDGNGLAVPSIIYSAQNVSPEAARLVDAVLVKSRRSLPDLKATIRRIVHKKNGQGAP